MELEYTPNPFPTTPRYMHPSRYPLKKAPTVFGSA
jgi:hypothetical protein